MNTKALAFFIVIAATLLIGSQSFFIVDEREQAIVLQLGQPKGEPRGPGIHFKTPFVQNIRYFDRRVLSIDPRPEQVVISSAYVEKNKDKATDEDNKDIDTEKGPSIDSVSGEPIIVDTFARYKIVNPLQFMKTLRTVANANSRIESILNDSTRAVLGETTLVELLSNARTSVMRDIRTRVNDKIQTDALGIEIVDVRIVRADLTNELRQSTVKQMISELNERATERRSKGNERALEIRSTAEKERTITLAEAGRDSQIIRGEGDKTAIKVYADAFNVDKEFYSFLRSMEAYKKTMANPETRLILSPDSDFFKHFNN
ncbi:MAG: protease modulator HflC [Alphaproteobacteria bacterium]|nr:MAG: protease modulator HflC [Alphaproteobacteria bacterium]